MLFEIINPSDPYTLRAEDPRVAMAAVLLLGNGQYGLRDEKDESYDTLLLFTSGEATEKRLQGMFGEGSLGGFLKEHKSAVADCLDSVMSFGFKERNTYDTWIEAIESEEKREEFRAKIHDKNRSSLNDIGGRAWEYAKRLREPDKSE